MSTLCERQLGFFLLPMYIGKEEGGWNFQVPMKPRESPSVPPAIYLETDGGFHVAVPILETRGFPLEGSTLLLAMAPL